MLRSPSTDLEPAASSREALTGATYTRRRSEQGDRAPAGSLPDRSRVGGLPPALSPTGSTLSRGSSPPHPLLALSSAQTGAQMSSTGSAPGNESGSEAPTETGSVALKRKSDDIGWSYGVLVDPSNLDKVKCIFCNHVSSGGIYRLKQHIGKVGNSVAKCKAITEQALVAQEKCKQSLEEAKRKKKQKQDRDNEIREDVSVSSVGGEEDDGSSGPNKLGPMDRFARPIDPKANPVEVKRQQNIIEALWKERTHQVRRYVARWVYTRGVPFNALDNDEFKQMCEAIGQFGSGFQPPTQYDLRENLLSEEFMRTKSLLSEREEEKIRNGCSIMTDAWTDMKRRSIMNLYTHCSMGTSFLKSKEMSDVSHTSEVIFNIVDEGIEEVGSEHVVQVVTDNASNNMGAKVLLHAKRPHIFWTSCATHTINLMLQGIGNLPKLKKPIAQAKAFTFIYSHHKTLALMRKFTKKRYHKTGGN